MNIGIIGAGAIGKYVCKKVLERGHTITVVARHNTAKLLEYEPAASCVSQVSELPTNIDHMIDCAGHEALKAYGVAILRRGIDLTTVSIGALADEELHHSLLQAAKEGDAQLHLVSGAIGALDCLRAARVGGLKEVTYLGRKPALSWKGTPAEKVLDLDALTTGKATHFSGSAREAATAYPKNANVAAAVALAGIGFDDTRVELIADADLQENVHEIEASGDFGNFSFRILGRTVPDNPKSSALAAMSVISSLEQETECIRF